MTTRGITAKSMPKARDTRLQGAGGRFGTTHNILTTKISEANTPAGDSFLPWSEEEVTSGGYSGDEEWENLPPATYCEWHKNKKAREHAAQWKRSEETYWDGEKSKIGIKRGSYKISGLATRTLQEKRQHAALKHMSGELDEAGYQRQLLHINSLAKKSTTVVQLTLPFVKRKDPPTADSSQPPAKRLCFEQYPGANAIMVPSQAGGPEPVSSSSLPPTPCCTVTVEDCDDISDHKLDNEFVGQYEDIAPLVTDELAKDMADGKEIKDFDNMMAEEVPVRSCKELQEAAYAQLHAVHRNKNYDAEQVYATLTDFCRWCPRMGKIASSLRVARNHGQGPYFARTVQAQASHFEAHDCVAHSRRGHRPTGTGLLNDEDVYMTLQWWLQTQKAGQVSVGFKNDWHVKGGFETDCFMA